MNNHRYAPRALAVGALALLLGYVTAGCIADIESEPEVDEEPLAEAQQELGGLGEGCKYNWIRQTYYCNAGLDCCTTYLPTVRRTCRDLQVDSNNCGSCGNTCDDPPYVCEFGECQVPN